MRKRLLFTILFTCIINFSVFRSVESASYRALSLKMLRQNSIQCTPSGMCSKDVIHLGGLKTIEGYVIDKVNYDVIIIGKTDDSLPPLYLDDFVISLRCAWKKYIESNVFTPPGCSIDPIDTSMKKLTDITKKISGSQSQENRSQLELEWNKTCEEPQLVRVLGVPYNSRFAQVMVKADYDMKRIVDGYDNLEIPEVKDILTLLSEEAQENFMKGKRKGRPIRLMNRFWFCPGEYSLTENNNTTMFEICDVQLLTEEQHLFRSGKNVGKGRINQYAEIVAETFTAHYNEIAKIRPIYKELENLLRLYTLSEAFKFKSVFKTAGLSIAYFLEEYQIVQHNVAKTLPGRPRFETFKYERKVKRWMHTLTIMAPSCGGVLYRVKIDKNTFSRMKNVTMRKIENSVLSHRPHKKALFWDINLDM